MASTDIRPRRRGRGRQQRHLETPMLAGSPVQRLRPLTAGRLLDGGFDLLRFRPKQTVMLVVVTWLPFFAASRYLGSFEALYEWVRHLTDRDQASQWPNLVIVAGNLLPMFGEMLIGVGMGILVSAWINGNDPTAVKLLSAVGRLLPRALVAWTSALLVKVAAASLCGIGILLAAPGLGVLGPVVGAERRNPLTAVNRSFHLTRSSRNLSIGIFLSSPVLSGLITLGVRASDQLGLIPIPYAASVVGGGLTAALAAWRSAVWALMYVNSRVIHEGLDLRIDLDRVLP